MGMPFKAKGGWISFIFLNINLNKLKCFHVLFGFSKVGHFTHVNLFYIAVIDGKLKR